MIDCSKCAKPCYLAKKRRVETCDAFRPVGQAGPPAATADKNVRPTIKRGKGPGGKTQ